MIKCDKCDQYSPCPSGQDAYTLKACNGRDFGLMDKSAVVKDVMNGIINKCPSFRRF